MRYLSRHLLKLAAARRIVREETDEANQLTRLHRRHHLDLGTCRSDVYAQSTGGRALFSYPMRGQTLEQRERRSRAPVMIGRLRRPDTIPRSCMQPSSTGSRLGLTPQAPAGQVCLEARGYQVSR